MLCFEELSIGLIDRIVGSDVLCLKCRLACCLKKKVFTLGTLKVTGLHVYENRIQHLILRYKEYHDELLHLAFFHSERLRITLLYNDYVVVCVPSTPSALKERGFDHCHLLATTLGLPVLKGVLSKKDVQKQLNVNKPERLKVRDNFVLNSLEDLEGKKVILLDDIVTSGASMMACYDLIKPYCKKVRGLCLAYHRDYEASL